MIAVHNCTLSLLLDVRSTVTVIRQAAAVPDDRSRFRGAVPVERPCRRRSLLGRHSTRKTGGERIALLQGTLDALILRILIFGSEHGQGIARRHRVFFDAEEQTG